MNEERLAIGAAAIRGLLLDEDFEEDTVDEYAAMYAQRVIEACLLATVLLNPETVRVERRELLDALAESRAEGWHPAEYCHPADKCPNEDRLDAAFRQVEELRTALSEAYKYMRHATWCAQWTHPSAGGPPCDCDYHAASDQVRAALARLSPRQEGSDG